METLLISACLLGANCKYNGGNNALPPEVLERLRQRYRLIPVCPETAGGLPIPREPSERRGRRVISRSGQDVTAARRGKGPAQKQQPLLRQRHDLRRELFRHINSG